MGQIRAGSAAFGDVNVLVEEAVFRRCKQCLLKSLSLSKPFGS